MDSLRFPKIEAIRLSSYSLFEKNPNPHLESPWGVTCLAGANGIGKSTFLATLNFAITGAVPLDTKKFKDAAEYATRARKFAPQYFEGRIKESYRDDACVSVWFTIGNKKIMISRGLFDGERLREFSIDAPSYERRLLDSSEIASDAKEYEYRSTISSEIGLTEFEQFIFLQHFVFTFDESRDLLFWSERPLDYALAMAFGDGPGAAKEAERLERLIDQFASKARNRKYMATQCLNTANNLQTAIASNSEPSTTDVNEIEQQYKVFAEKQDSIKKDLIFYRHKFNEAKAKYSMLVAETDAKAKEYEGFFRSIFIGNRQLDAHPTIRLLLDTKQCDICGSTDPSALENVKNSLQNSVCPLCNNDHSKAGEPNETQLLELQHLDDEIAKTRKSKNEQSSAIDRITKELDALEEHLNSSQNELDEFLSVNRNVVNYLKFSSEKSAIKEKIDELTRQYDQFSKESAEHYKKRDAYRDERNELISGISSKYYAVEEEFSSTVRQFAMSFIGLEVDVRLSSKKLLSLTLILNNSERNLDFQLSESQRFFLDIALRMAIARHLSDDDYEATLLIDTPEGSLDIAYEHRAGEMFGEFVEMQHSIIMTANINTSELLRALATKTTASNMKLVRMTDWAELSDVQLLQLDRFDQAYGEIEQLLGA